MEVMCKVLLAIYYFDVFILQKIFLGEKPQTHLNATTICAEIRTKVRSVHMLSPSIDSVLATPLSVTLGDHAAYGN